MTNLIRSEKYSLTELPLTVLETILEYLNCKDIFNFRATCKYFHTLCAYKIRNDLKALKNNIYAEVKKKQETCKIKFGIKEGEKNLRYKYLLQILHTEISLILIVFRQILQNGNFCLCFGELVDDFQLILSKIKSKSIRSWTDMKIYNKVVHSKVSCYINNLTDGLINLSSIGIQMIDLLDITLNSKYLINVTYNTEIQTCNIKAKYEIDNLKILNFLPDLSSVDCKNQPLTQEEKALVVNCFALMIKIHNYFMIQDEHYQEKIRLYQGQELNTDSKTYIKNKYTTERVQKNEHEIQEIYKNVPGPLIYSGKGLWFEINLKCSINEAPLQILKNWERIVKEIGKKITDSNKSEVLTNSTYKIFIKFKKYLSESFNCINIIQT